MFFCNFGIQSFGWMTMIINIAEQVIYKLIFSYFIIIVLYSHIWAGRKWSAVERNWSAQYVKGQHIA